MEQYKVKLTKPHHPDFLEFLDKLWEELKCIDELRRSGHKQPQDSIEKIKRVALVYNGAKAIGCGALTQDSSKVGAISRVFIDQSYRGNGVAGKAVSALETLASQDGLDFVRADILKGNSASLTAFEKMGYTRYFDLAHLKNNSPEYGTFIHVVKHLKEKSHESCK